MLIVFLSVTIVSCKKGIREPDFAEMERTFKNIPDSIQTSVYWYWISDNISEEGVIKDLHAMKEAGITRAFIGNIGLGPDEVPYGQVKFNSEEWWDILHTALKTATELDIEIGIFNSPGWSQSGGPWIKPERSMRFLDASRLFIKGPGKNTCLLPKPSDDFQDVCVLACGINPGLNQSLLDLDPNITSFPSVQFTENLSDADISTGTNLLPGADLIIDYKFPGPVCLNNITIRPMEKPIHVKAEVYSGKNGVFEFIDSFEVNRSNLMRSVGFIPYGPVSISIPSVTSSEFKIVFKASSLPGGIAEIELSSVPRVERYIEKTLAKMHQTPTPDWYEYMWRDQPDHSDTSFFISPGRVLDISKYMADDGTLTWDAPEGHWLVLRTGMRTTGVVNEPATPEATGLETDKMSREHIEFHFDSFLGEIIRRIPPADRRSFKVSVLDSYERGGQNWTDGFREKFEKQYGYDPVPYVPAYYGYVVGNQDMSDRFLWDIRRFIADRIAYEYVGGLREICHKNGLTTWLECYGHWGFPGEFLQYGGQSDEVAGEFWSEGNLGNIENRAASSCAHIYGKKKVSSESFTCGGRAYSRYPALVKKRGDRFFTEGINNTLLHVYIQQPCDDKVPGVNAGFGDEFNRHNTWFPYLDLFTSYLKRVNYMLQQGNYVADAAYFIGEDVPKMTGVRNPELPAGYSYDYINAEVLLTRATVRDNCLILQGGMKYRVLVLPPLKTMRPEVLQKIHDFIQAGLVIVGSAPERSPSLKDYPDADQRVRNLASGLWKSPTGKAEIRVGKGSIFQGMSLEEVFASLDMVPDFVTNPSDSILFIHRETGEGDIYFVSNQTDRVISVTPQFRVTGKQPEIWDPVSGSQRELPAFRTNMNHTSVPLKLEASESQFIIFRNDITDQGLNDPLANFPEPDVLRTINEPWCVQFDSLMRGPVHPVIFDTLIDWTQSSNDSIRYYSGTATYTTNIVIPAVPQDHRILLQPGKLSAIARVRVNGKEAGGVWTAPWQTDVTGLLDAGENKIEIDVANTWVNRLIGDLKLPEEERKTWTTVMPYNADSPLQASGLTGPVQLVKIKYQGNH